jgi:glycosyltransferase involved in cell wall biosynthesis
MNPEVSVVMGVRNGASSLERTVRSILAQSYDAFEFLVVDDGSTDETPGILASLAKEDQRLRILTQENGGLTRALMRGCAESRGRYIARQDAGDVSLPGRLAALAEVLDADESVGFACGSTEFFGPGGEALYVASSAGVDGRFGALDRIALGGPGPSHHGATMIRRSLYEQSGGYRAAFAMAQDWDLWFRLIESSRFYAVDAIHYQAEVNPMGISMAGIQNQRALGKLAEEAHRLRMLGHPDAGCCAEAKVIGRGGPGRKSSADGHYFLGALLLARGHPICRKYLLQAALERPQHLKTWLLLLKSFTLSGT